MDRRRLILLGIMVPVALFLFFQLRQMGAPKKAPPPKPVAVPQQVVEQVQYSDVLIASSDISFGTRLGEMHMAWKQWPADVVSPDFITRENKPQAMENMLGGVVRSEIYSGEPITKRKIVMPGEKSVMSALLQPGMRAVTTRISVDTAAGGFIQPGDNVDIILTSAISKGAAGGKRIVSQTIFENVRVLAIDQTFATTSESRASVIGSTATFEMTQRDAEVLQQSVAQGDLSLTLRPLGKSAAPGKSLSSVSRKSGDVASMTIYRNGQPTQVAIRGQ